MSRLPVLKTYKLFIAGQFPRTESGRYYELKNTKQQIIANVCLGSRKDFKNSVVAARTSFPSWSGRSAFNRGQILYRIAEMLEGRKSQFTEEMLLQGISKKAAESEISLSIDRLIHYAGWCDKYQQIFSSVNPVASSHFNFSVPEPAGVISVIAPETSGLLGLISVIAPIIIGGNTCIVLASEKLPLSAITFCEVLATSDLPHGVINVLTGASRELHSHFSSHMDVNAIVYCRNNKAEIKLIQENCSLNVKRFYHWNKDWTKVENQNPYLILNLQEIKTTWHPIENNSVSGAKY
ncbi:aldehyde dehydrogenase family protein [Aurantibacillus circumpalustris]|uniref:aldehyde dehydrogenase family protein n=1 Tax=Aurantibacillus circumpalustris TaxID=3036359 RepID=UPI00295AFAF5|nr:aldehyde dehydrogenase family protein [Aurantibacillus circumpalustris]